jgi:hypothetical protein
MLQHSAAEELGDLRTSIDLTHNKLSDFNEIVVDDDGNFHAVAGTQADCA